MFSSVIKAMPVILAVSVLTGLFYLVLPRLMLEQAAVQAKGLARAGVETSIWTAVGSIFFGTIIVAIYLWAGGRWPGMQASIFFKLGIISQ